MPDKRHQSGSVKTDDASRDILPKGGKKASHAKTHGLGAIPEGHGTGPVYRKIHPAELPVIGLNSGNQLHNIAEAISAYCQKEGFGSIYLMFTRLRYEDLMTVEYDPKKLTDKEDPFQFERYKVQSRLKAADLENEKYRASKQKLLGVLNTMTTKEVDEKLISHAAAIKKYLEASKPSLTSDYPDPKEKIGDIETCPLTRWKAITFILTSKTSGNRRIDQDTAATTFSTMKQRNGESTNEYLARFRVAVESYEMLGLEPPSQEVQSMRFIQGLDSARFGAMQTYFGNELLLDRDLYPVDLATAAERASTWLVTSNKGPVDVAHHTAFSLIKEKPAKGTRDAKDPKATKINTLNKDSKKCEFCGKGGHLMLDCFKFKAAQVIAQAQPPHAKDSAPASNSKGKKSGKKTALIASFDDHNSDEDDLEYMANYLGDNRAAFVSTMSALSGGGASSVPPDAIILDSGANASIIKNRKLVHNVHKVPMVKFDGVGGGLLVDLAGELLDLGPTFYNPRSVANIVSLSQLRAQGHNIRLSLGDSDSDDVFIVKTHTRTYRFPKMSNGLYVCDVSPIRFTAIATVKDNKARYTNAENNRADAARDFRTCLAYPPDNKLIRALSFGNIKDPPVSPADVRRATAIFGPSIEALKGRTTKAKAQPFPLQEPNDRVTAPQDLYADIFYAGQTPFLITVIKPLGHIKVSHIEKPDTPTLRKTLRIHLGTYGQRRITVHNIYSDNEKGILAMASDFSAAGITLHVCGPGMHISVIERTIRYVKEGVRGTLSGLPYTCSARLFRLLVIFVADRLNIFPSSTRTDNLSAFQLIYNRTPSAKYDLNLEFGAIYQVTNRLGDNTMTPRTSAPSESPNLPTAQAPASFST